MTPDRVLVTAGTSEGIELALSALVDHGGEVLVPLPTYPLYTAVIAKLGARAVYYRTRSASGGGFRTSITCAASSHRQRARWS